MARISIFPLSGVMLYPQLQLPLHIFEPRYRALVTDALARDRRIGMIQPNSQPRPGGARELPATGPGAQGPSLYAVGCVGRIAEVEALEDGRFNIILEGEHRFRRIRELAVTTPFRQIEAELIEDNDVEALSPVERASFEREARRFADRQGYSVDWDRVIRLDDGALINGVAQIAPFDSAAKQALLEADSLAQRCELLVQLMQFFGRSNDEGDEGVTLQ